MLIPNEYTLLGDEGLQAYFTVLRTYSWLRIALDQPPVVFGNQIVVPG